MSPRRFGSVEGLWAAGAGGVEAQLSRGVPAQTSAAERASAGGSVAGLAGPPTPTVVGARVGAQPESQGTNEEDEGDERVFHAHMVAPNLLQS